MDHHKSIVPSSHAILHADDIIPKAPIVSTNGLPRSYSAFTADTLGGSISEVTGTSECQNVHRNVFDTASPSYFLYGLDSLWTTVPAHASTCNKPVLDPFFRESSRGRSSPLQPFANIHRASPNVQELPEPAVHSAYQPIAVDNSEAQLWHTVPSTTQFSEGVGFLQHSRQMLALPFSSKIATPRKESTTLNTSTRQQVEPARTYIPQFCL